MNKKYTDGEWRITRRTTPGQFVTEIVIRNEHKEVIAVMHGKDADAPLVAASKNLLESLIRVSLDLEAIISHNRKPGNTRTVSEAMLVGMEHHLSDAQKAIEKAQKPFSYGGSKDVELVN